MLILFLMALTAAVYFGLRLFLLKKSMREAGRELEEIRKDLKQNRVLHLPVPDRDLETLMSSVNSTLYEIRRERNTYEKREREFQRQIEAISHDLCTPLTVLSGYLKILRRQGGDPNAFFTGEQCEMLDTAVRKARTMEKLVAQFYEYSRFFGDKEVELETMDAGRILREVFVENCLILENAGLDAAACFPDFPLWAEGNRDDLERIFVNLMQNAARYGRSWVRIAVEQEKSRVKIVFENDTEELTEQDIPNLFLRFYQKDSARSRGGSGLGLTIAKKLAERMGGTLEADMERTSVIRFVLRLQAGKPDISPE